MVSGGTNPYTYLWSNGATTDSIFNLSAGIYTITVTDAHGCTAINTIAITQPSLLTANGTVTGNVNCNGGNNGSGSVTVSGGTTAYNYLWSNGATTSSISSLSAGTYSETVIDANGSIANANITITQPANPMATSFCSATHGVTCYGGNNGKTAVMVSGGTSPYTFHWSNGATTDSIFNLSAGIYTITVTDAHGCTSTNSIAITQPTLLTATSTVGGNVNCFGGNNGNGSVTASGGTTAYNYLWSNGATTSSISSLSAGTYSVTVIDANGCIANANITITQPANPMATSFCSATHGVTCYGGSNGKTAVMISGGTSPYTFHWSNGATTDSIFNLTAGVYTITVTDAHGCTSTNSIAITQPTLLSATSTVGGNVNCFGGNNGNGSVTASGGTTAYNYLWSNGATTSSISSLSAGAYSVTVIDANGCTANANITITQPASALTAVNCSYTQNVSCNGGNNGSTTAIVNGGTSPYTYNWSNGQTNATISNLTAGTYSVTVTDSHGCTSTFSVTITQPNVLVATTTVSNNVSCNGGNNGSGNVTVTGGTTPYNYTWSNGATTSSISGLSAGSYSVLILDANGCSAHGTITISQPTVLTAGISVVSIINVTCNGSNNGSATVSALGGTPNYSYKWSTNCGSQTNATATGLAAGTYTVTVTDANGCTATTSVTITKPSTLTASASCGANVSCNGGNNGSASVSVSGGTTSYTYHWSNGATTSSISNLTRGYLFSNCN